MAVTSSQSGKEHLQTKTRKQNSLEKCRKYKKMKRAQETETEKQNRIENVKQYKKAKQNAESESEKQLRLENDRKYEKAKREQETSIQKQTRLDQASEYKKKRTICSSAKIEKQQDYLNKFDVKNNGSTVFMNRVGQTLTLPSFTRLLNFLLLNAQYVKKHGH